MSVDLKYINFEELTLVNWLHATNSYIRNIGRTGGRYWFCKGSDGYWSGGVYVNEEHRVYSITNQDGTGLTLEHSYNDGSTPSISGDKWIVLNELLRVYGTVIISASVWGLWHYDSFSGTSYLTGQKIYWSYSIDGGVSWTDGSYSLSLGNENAVIVDLVWNFDSSYAHMIYTDSSAPPIVIYYLKDISLDPSTPSLTTLKTGLKNINAVWGGYFDNTFSGTTILSQYYHYLYVDTSSRMHHVIFDYTSFSEISDTILTGITLPTTYDISLQAYMLKNNVEVILQRNAVITRKNSGEWTSKTTTDTTSVGIIWYDNADYEYIMNYFIWGSGVYDIITSGAVVKIFDIGSTIARVGYIDWFIDPVNVKVYQKTLSDFNASVCIVENEIHKAPKCELKSQIEPFDNQFLFLYKGTNLIYRGKVVKFRYNAREYTWIMRSGIEDDLNRPVDISFTSKTPTEILSSIISTYCYYLYTDTHLQTPTTTTYSPSFKKNVWDVFKWVESVTGYAITWVTEGDNYGEVYLDQFDQHTAGSFDTSVDSYSYPSEPYEQKPIKPAHFVLKGGIVNGERVSLDKWAAPSGALYYDRFSSVTSSNELETIYNSLKSQKNITLTIFSPNYFDPSFTTSFIVGQQVVVSDALYGLSSDTMFVMRVRKDYLTGRQRVYFYNALYLPDTNQSVNERITNLEQDIETHAAQIMAGAEGGQINLNNKEIWLKDGATESDFDNALALLIDSGGGTLHLPVGTITFTTQKVISVPIRIVGHGIHISIIVSNVAGSLFKITSRYCVFERFEVSLDPGSGYTHGFSIENNYNLFKDLYVAGTVDSDTIDSIAFEEESSANRYYNSWINCMAVNIKTGWSLHGYLQQLTVCRSINVLIGILFNTALYANVSNHQFISLGPSDSDMYALDFVSSSYCNIVGCSGYFATSGAGTRYGYYLDASSNYNRIYAFYVAATGTNVDSGTGNSVV